MPALETFHCLILEVADLLVHVETLIESDKEEGYADIPVSRFSDVQRKFLEPGYFFDLEIWDGWWRIKFPEPKYWTAEDIAWIDAEAKKLQKMVEEIF